MPGVTIISHIPSLTSASLTDVVQGIIQASMQGIRVYVSASVYKKLESLFNELGIKARPVQTPVVEDTYIIIKSAGGIRVKIEVVEAGNVVNSITTTVTALERAFKEVLEKQNGSTQSPGLFEIIVPDQLKQPLSQLSSEGEEDEGT